MWLLSAAWGLLTRNPLARWLGGALAALAALWMYGQAKKRQGAQDANMEALENDRSRARQIQDAADAARLGGNGDPVERLQSANRIRD